MGNLADLLQQEMEHTFMMLKTAVSRAQGQFWKENQNDWTYGYTLFHAIEAVEFYMSDSIENWTPLSDVSQNSREKETLTLSNTDDSFFPDYLRKVEIKTFDVLNKFDDQQLLENDGFGERGFKSRFHKFSYTMRHTMYHLGELTKHLRSLDMERIKW